ncbi:hypothetical protein OOK31_12745 [Streptomyces sp. NBC_00249]|uniref:hypothetical protein n=1 Tax=Streptomyces sp. NBC_00249 TaxID=2975690 RepID=UPI0022531145|nr:hypothetical protein [Streptomyces sp. NBC_00249]MCX5194755.1 hypothetical protein [Streptomyces sp. NBC_00249]
MRLQRIFAATAALASLTALATACEDPAKAGPPATAPTATPGATAEASPAAQASPAGKGAAPASLAEAQAYVQKYTSCENLSTDPNDSRVNLAGYIPVGTWSVTERGICSDKNEHGEIVFDMVSDMKAHQQAYKDRIAQRLAEGYWDAGLYDQIVVGKSFALTATKTGTTLALVKSDLRVLVCNPDFAVPEGYKKEKALVDGCVLTDFVNSRDGKGSPVKGPGLPSAGSIEELRKLVSPQPVDCTDMLVTDEHVESIDYLPVVGRDGRSAWGVKQRAICGQLGGERRAHNLNWLDTVSDMKTLQARSKAAQLAEVGKQRKATQSKLLVGTNIAVETNSKSIRQGLYKLRFLRLDCEPGFTAPAGARVEKAQVEGCVLTDFERPS